LSVTFLLLAIPEWTAARTWQVLNDGSGDAATVQAGIDSAAEGDTVLVQPGTYHEMIVFRGRNVVVQSASGPQSTILDASGLGGRVVRFENGEVRASVLEGFTITHGVGGIIVLKSQPSLIGNIITNNDAGSGNGGGLWLSADTFNPWFPFIKGNWISNNHAENGGGIGFGPRMIPELYDNHIDGNEAGNGNGGGIYLSGSDSSPDISGNFILNNRAGDHGGGIYAEFSQQVGGLRIKVTLNLISGNLASGRTQTGNSGGAIWLSRSYAAVDNNTIVGNTGDGPSEGYGAGIVMADAGAPVIEKNVIAFNLKGGAIWCEEGVLATIRNNLTWQNSGGDSVGVCPAWQHSEGNVVDNPYFCDMAAADFTVASNSGVMTHPAGPLGAFAIPGCGPVSILPSTWGTLKTRY